MRQLIIGLGGFLLFAAACGSAPESAPETSASPNDTLLVLTELQEANIAPEFDQIQRREIVALLRLNGTVEVAPQGIYAVSAPLGGYLRHTRLTHGMRVKKGETIAVLEDLRYVELQRDYLQTRQELALAETESRRQAELNPSKTASDKALQQAQSTVEMLKIRLQAAAEQLRLIGYDPNSLSADQISARLSLRAPFDAYVSEIHARIGAYMASETSLFVLINPKATYLALRVLEKDLPLLRPGLSVKAWPAYRPDQPMTARLTIVGKEFGADNLAHAHAEWNEPVSDLIYPGMTVNATVACPSAPEPAIPSEALLNYEGNAYVFVKQGDRRFALTSVNPTSVRDARWVGLSEADYERLQNASIVIKGAYTLLMALKNKEEE